MRCGNSEVHKLDTKTFVVMFVWLIFNFVVALAHKMELVSAGTFFKRFV